MVERAWWEDMPHSIPPVGHGTVLKPPSSAPTTPGEGTVLRPGYGTAANPRKITLPEVAPAVQTTPVAPASRAPMIGAGITGALQSILQTYTENLQAEVAQEQLSHVKEIARQDAARMQQLISASVEQQQHQANLVGRMQLTQESQRTRFARAQAMAVAAQRGVAGTGVSTLEDALAIQDAQRMEAIRKGIERQKLATVEQARVQRAQVRTQLGQIEAQQGPQKTDPAMMLLQGLAAGLQSGAAAAG